MPPRFASLSAALCAALLACSSPPPGSSTDANAATTKGTGESGDSTDVSSESTESESSGSLDASETETGDPCDPAQWVPCLEVLADEAKDCTATCGCGDLECLDACHPDHGGFENPYFACVEDVLFTCGVESDLYEMCNQLCDAERAACDAEGCDPNWCEFDEMLCTDSCSLCPEHAHFEYPYEGSCTVEMVAPPPPSIHAPYVDAKIGLMYLDLLLRSGGCAEGFDGEWSDESMQALILCDEACAAFEATGTIEMTYGAPPCE